jgi:hypothetical protein
MFSGISSSPHGTSPTGGSMKLKVCCLLLLLGQVMFIAKADSANPNGSYAVQGNVTMTGTVMGPCGTSPCIQSMDFSFQMSVVSVGGDLSAYYIDHIMGGPGFSFFSGPLGSTWDMYVNQAESLGYLGFVTHSAPYTEIDVIPFNGPFGIPHSYSGAGGAFFYICNSDVSTDFGCNYRAYTTLTVQQVPEPHPLLLVLIGVLATLAVWCLFHAVSSRAVLIARRNCQHSSPTI